MTEDKQNELHKNAAVGISSVSKAFAARPVLRNIDLDVQRSQSVCLCGVNGAGKTTLLRIIAGLLHPDAGSIALNGYSLRKDPGKAKPQLGVILHKSMVYLDLTVCENLSFFATLYAVKDSAVRVKELIHDVGLDAYRYDKAGILSRGLLQRLAIARALVHRPKILLADEPFTGLDSEASKYLLSVFAEFTGAGGTIIMTTHDINAGLQCCRRVVVLDNCRIIFDAMASDINTDAFAQDYLAYARSGM